MEERHRLSGIPTSVFKIVESMSKQRFLFVELKHLPIFVFYIAENRKSHSDDPKNKWSETTSPIQAPAAVEIKADICHLRMPTIWINDKLFSSSSWEELTAGIYSEA